MRLRHASCLRRGTALYVAVLSTALVVSLLGITGSTIVRIERNQMATSGDRRDARMNAASAIQWALREIANDPDWRTTYTSGTETAPQSLGTNGKGTLSWILEDSDASLTDGDTELRLRGVGRLGTTVQVSSIELQSATSQVGPQELRSMTSTSSQSEDDVLFDKLWCQYLRPTLPADATGWWVTRVEIYCARESNNRTLSVRLFEPVSGNMPGSTAIDEISVSSGTIGSSWHFHSFDLTGAAILDPADGICVAVMTTSSSAPVKIAYRSGGLSEPDSALITGDPTWNSYETDKALRYRVHGVYTTTGALEPVMGTWQWDAIP